MCLNQDLFFLSGFISTYPNLLGKKSYVVVVVVVVVSVQQDFESHENAEKPQICAEGDKSK